MHPLVMAFRKGRRVWLLGLALQLLVLLVLAKRYLPKRHKGIRELDWNQFHQQDEACEWLGHFGAAVAYPGANMTKVLLLRGAAAHWPILNAISIPWLLEETLQEHLGTTIISSDSTFRVLDNSTELMRQSGDPWLAAKLPARLELTTIWEFAKRRIHEAKPPYYYPDGEYYLYQGPIPYELVDALPLTSRPLSCLNQALADANTIRLARHDPQPSLLLQLKGETDAWIVPNTQLNLVSPYEEGHLLFRSARVNITHPDLQTFPEAKGLQTQKIRLHPGDFLILPGYTTCQAETVTDSISGFPFVMDLVLYGSGGVPAT
ncbi:hypothetical protein WJX73_001681 [Symbiochloris irregularis]|uniref:Cupin-like domain-containing protein n=1 Tax=Symbiochloris irregularis TaxID=706552 RepID=A0AAW1Q070_9CHLO